MDPGAASGELQRNRPLGFRILHEFPSPSEEAAWRAFLTYADWPSHYTSPEFFREPFWTGKRPFAILITDGDKVVAVSTGLREADRVISGLRSRPQVCFDPGVDLSRVVAALSGGLLEEAGSAKLVTLFAWMPLKSAERLGFRRRIFEGNVVLDLTKGPDALFRQCQESRRRNIRKATREGIEVFQASNEDDLRAYYEVYCRWQKTERKQIDGMQLPFDVLHAMYELRNSRRLFLARHAGKIIAGTTVRFFPGGLLEYSGNSSLDEHLHLRPNDLLWWKTIEWGCAQGFQRYSLGGAHHFLRKSGGTIVAIYRYRLDRTWGRRHDLLEIPVDMARRVVRSVPALKRVIRNVPLLERVRHRMRRE